MQLEANATDLLVIFQARALVYILLHDWRMPAFPIDLDLITVTFAENSLKNGRQSETVKTRVSAKTKALKIDNMNLPFCANLFM